MLSERENRPVVAVPDKGKMRTGLHDTLAIEHGYELLLARIRMWWKRGENQSKQLPSHVKGEGRGCRRCSSRPKPLFSLHQAFNSISQSNLPSVRETSCQDIKPSVIIMLH